MANDRWRLQWKLKKKELSFRLRELMRMARKPLIPHDPVFPPRVDFSAAREPALMVAGGASKVSDALSRMFPLKAPPCYVVLESPPYEEMHVPDSIKETMRLFEEHHQKTISLTLGMGLLDLEKKMFADPCAKVSIMSEGRKINIRKDAE